MNRLDEIEARANAATEGPWRKFQTAQTATTYVVGPRGFLAGGLIIGETYERDNAEFIAHARTDVPWLIEQVRKRDAALRAVMDLHAPDPYCGNTHHDPNRCPCAITACADGCDTYPCPTVRAIEEALS